MKGLYVGVVEDRNDPMEMSRVRVRVFGIHTPERWNDLPIDFRKWECIEEDSDRKPEDRPGLPWCTVLMPTTHSTTSGNIPQMVEGTWVIITFLDDNFQDGLVLGTLTSTAAHKPDYNQGFSDPYGVYPKWIKGEGESEVSLVGRPSTWEEHPTYIERAKYQVVEVPTAQAYPMDTVTSNSSADYERIPWDEKPIRGGQSSMYPYNAIREFEAGMIEEYDSTPTNSSRITKMHRSGTYEEILHDGTRTVKIVSDGFEIVLKDKNIYIKGDLNLTVEGSMKQLVKGDYLLEVGGNFHTTVGKSSFMKVIENDNREVIGDSSTNIEGFHSLRCGDDQTIQVVKERSVTVGEHEYVHIMGHQHVQIDEYMQTLVKETILFKADDDVTVVGAEIYLNP